MFNLAEVTVVTTSTTSTSSGSAVIIGLLIGLVIAVIAIAAMWKVFVKAGHPGWAAIIPIYNTYVAIKIAGRPGWWLLVILFIPILDIIFAIIVALDIAKNFGRSALFGVFGLIIFSLIGWLILGFGDDEYVGPGKAAAAPTTT